MNKTREELVADLQRRVADHILEPTNAALLERLIMQAVDDNEAVMIASLGTTYKRTGLHFDKRLERPTPEIHYLRRNKALSFGDGETPHRLIIGDNLHALQNLLIQYRGQVDVIYIDPPYGKDSMGEFAETNYENAITRDNLLSMLHPRLMLARQLLSDSGVIFCSIDDRNQAYVKCLFDDVFGERNYITTLPRKGAGGRQDSKQYAVVHEYVVTYAREIDLYESGRAHKDAGEFNCVDDKTGRRYRTQLLRKWGDNSRREDRPNLFYPIYYNPLERRCSLERLSDSDCEIFPMLDEKKEGCWRWGRETMRMALKDAVVEVQMKKGVYIPYERIYEDKVSDTKPFSSWIDDINNETGSTLVKEILGDAVFDYPKPVDLIVRLLKMASTQKDLTILDFFAGSGTTGQAVLELNRQDGGNRRFILCQLNEVTDTTPNGIAHDVTAKRLKRVMTGECYDGKRDFAWAQKNQPYGGSLEVADIATVADFNALPGQSAFDVIDETLYGQQRFERMEQKVEWVCRNFEPTQVSLEGDREWRARRMEADQR